MRSLNLAVLVYLTLTIPAWAVTCGDILGPGGMHILTADLICEGDDPALTVRDGAVLDLAGHLVKSPSLGILVEGQGATLQHGRVEVLEAGELAVGVQVQGVGRHQITGMIVNSGAAGFVVSSDHNRFTESVGAGDFGFLIEGHHNILRQNTGGGILGFGVFGDGNRLSENVTGNGPFTGFFVDGSRNILLGNITIAVFQGIIIHGDGNLVLRNQASGSLAIAVSGENNRLIRNTATSSELGGEGGFVDEHGDCSHNRWIGNVAAMADPPCILEGPITVSEAR